MGLIEMQLQCMSIWKTQAQSKELKVSELVYLIVGVLISYISYFKSVGNW